MTSVLFIAEHSPSEPKIVAWHEKIRTILSEYRAEIFDVPQDDITITDGYVADISGASPELFRTIEAALDTGKSTVVFGLSAFVGKSPIEIPETQLKVMSRDAMASYLGIFLGLKMGLSMPAENDVARMPMQDPKTLKKLRLTSEQAAHIRQMEQNDEY